MSDSFIKQSGTPWTEGEIQYAKRVLEFSETVTAAASKLGISDSSLRKAFKRRGLPNPSEFLTESEDSAQKDLSSKAIQQKI